MEPDGNRSTSEKKLDCTSVNDKARTRHSSVRSSRPSRRLLLRVTEYPTLPPSKKAEASVKDLKQDVRGNDSASSPATVIETRPSRDRIESSIWLPMSSTENRA